MANGKKVHLVPSAQKVSPIHCDNLAEIVGAVLAGGVGSQTLVAKGNESLNWNDNLKTLQQSLGVKAEVSGGSFLSSPLQNNMLSEMCFQPCYINTIR